MRICASQPSQASRHYRERNAKETTAEEDLRVLGIVDVTSKELPWPAVRKAREHELKYLRHLGVYEEIDELEAINKD